MGEGDLTLDTIRDISLYQPRDGYRFSVDSLLLFNFVNLQRAERIADLGAGCGIIGILLAKKYKGSSVTLFEIQPLLADIARRNIDINTLTNRITVINKDLKEISQTLPSLGSSFDVVVSNPPFRKIKSGRINPVEEKAMARHEIAIDLPGLINISNFLLCPKGRIFLIYHPSRLSELTLELKRQGIEIKRLRFVHSSVYTEAKMVLAEGVKGGRAGLKIEKPFFIYNKKDEYSEEMRYILDK